MVEKINNDNLMTFTDAPMVVLDFWATWCGPCKIMSPIIEELATDFKGKIKFGSVDVDKYKEIALKYHVLGMPTLVIFKNGKATEKVTGVYQKPALTKFLNQRLAK